MMLPALEPLAPVASVLAAVSLTIHGGRLIPMETASMSAADVTPYDPYAEPQATELPEPSCGLGNGVLGFDPMDVLSELGGLGGLGGLLGGGEGNAPTPTQMQTAYTTQTQTAYTTMITMTKEDSKRFLTTPPTMPTGYGYGFIPQPEAETSTSTTSSTAAQPSSTGNSSSSWEDTQVTQTDSSLQQTAEDAIKKLLTYNTGSSTGGEYTFADPLAWWQSANAYTSVFNFDIATSGKTFQETAGQDLLKLIKLEHWGMPGLFNNFNDDTLWWALACLDAYQAYGDTEYVDQAVHLWKLVGATSQINQTGVAPNQGGLRRSAKVSSSCKLENGVYWTTEVDETYIASISTVLYMQVSARLYEVLKNQTYLNTAENTLTWLQAHVVDPNTSLLTIDGINATTCGVHPGAFTYNTGVYIGGLVSLYQTTGNSDYLTEAEKAAKGTMVTPAWTDGNGLITEAKGSKNNNDGVGFRCVLIRDLIRLYGQTSDDSLKQTIKGFVNVNYNLLYTKARDGDDYDVNWYGPFTNATDVGQFSAIDLLNAGVVVNDGVEQQSDDLGLF